MRLTPSKDLAIGDIEACFREGDVEACLWTVVGLIPWAKVGSVIKAFGKITPKVAKWLDKINDARKRLDEAADAVSSCLIDLTGSARVAPQRSAGSGFSAPAAAAGKPKKCPVPGAAVLNNIKEIREGRGSARRTGTGEIEVWTGEKGIVNPKTNVRIETPLAVKRKWANSLEYDVPGSRAPGTTRILVKLKADGTIERMGWTVNHYFTIYEFPLS